MSNVQSDPSALDYELAVIPFESVQARMKLALAIGLPMHRATF